MDHTADPTRHHARRTIVTVTTHERGSRSACASLPSPLTTAERTGLARPGQAEPVTAQAQALRGTG